MNTYFFTSLKAGQFNIERFSVCGLSSIEMYSAKVLIISP